MTPASSQAMRAVVEATWRHGDHAVDLLRDSDYGRDTVYIGCRGCGAVRRVDVGRFAVSGEADLVRRVVDEYAVWKAETPGSCEQVRRLRAVREIMDM